MATDDILMLILHSNLILKNLALLVGFQCGLMIIQNWFTVHWATLYTKRTPLKH